LRRDVEAGPVTKLTLSYDGAGFAGWARQPACAPCRRSSRARSAQILGEPLVLSVAGRTDRGVHAWGQVASYRHEALDPRRLNALLPHDVAVLASEPAAGDFDAPGTHSARAVLVRASAPAGEDAVAVGAAAGAAARVEVARRRLAREHRHVVGEQRGSGAAGRSASWR